MPSRQTKTKQLEYSKTCKSTPWGLLRPGDRYALGALHPSFVDWVTGSTVCNLVERRNKTKHVQQLVQTEHTTTVVVYATAYMPIYVHMSTHSDACIYIYIYIYSDIQTMNKRYLF